LTNRDERDIVLRNIGTAWPGSNEALYVSIVKVTHARRRPPFLVRLRPLQTCRIYFDASFVSIPPGARVFSARTRLKQIAFGNVLVGLTTGELFDIALPDEYRRWLATRIESIWLKHVALFLINCKPALSKLFSN
jgi:hypothetical protein